MKTSIYVFLAILFFVFSDVSAQFTQEWVARYNGTGNGVDKVSSMVVDSSGNVYITGRSSGSISPYDYATVKYNSSGVQQWVARYDGISNGNDYPNSIALDVSGNVYVTGESYNSGPYPSSKYATVKYNYSGAQQWVAIFDGSHEGDYAKSIAVDASGNVYVTGQIYGPYSPSSYGTVKYNSFGAQQWFAIYAGPKNSYNVAHSIKVDASGNVYVTGLSSGIGTSLDYATVKYNSSGVQQWVARYNGTGNGVDEAYSMVLDDSGNVYVTGKSMGSGTLLDFATIKYNSNGVQQWVARYNNGLNSGNEYASSIAIDLLGNVYVTGSSYVFRLDYVTVKYNSSGVQQWEARYNGTGNNDDIPHSIAIDAFGNVYVTGESLGSGTGWDYATVKYNSTGMQQWVARYNVKDSINDIASSIALDGLGNVYVTGSSEGIGSWDFTTIKYSQSTGIQNISSEIPENFLLSQNYPNPFNPSTKIKFAIPNNSYVKLVVYDELGREVQSLVNENLNTGTFEASFDAGNLSSGIYFYKLTAGNFSQTKKMLLLK